MKIPLAICLFTSTRGHHGIKNRWLETVNSLNNQIPLSNFSGLFFNIKATSEEELKQAEEMAHTLKRMGFKGRIKVGYWKHEQGNSHQEEYLKDIIDAYTNPEILENQYIIHVEDDWLLNPYSRDLLYYIHNAIKMLEKDPELLQVRFPRFNNEYSRILNLKEKHGINATAWTSSDYSFWHNDFSLNPSIFRSRDLRAAALLFKKNPNSFPTHVEHGFGAALKYFSQNNETCFYCFNPEDIRALHIGSPSGMEDKADVSLNSD